MNIVLDTNILVSALSRKSDDHWVVRDLLDGKFVLVVSHDILLEYEEILKMKYGVVITENFLEALWNLPNIRKVDPRFKWKFLKDPDDDKFVDAAVASNVDFIVSEDRSFRQLKKVEFPKVVVLRLLDFWQILNQF